MKDDAVVLTPKQVINLPPLMYTLGDNILKMIAQVTMRGTLANVEEFVANIYDSDGENGCINYRPGEDFLEFRDDGLGMTPLQVPNFYRSGDSSKIDEREVKKRTPKGRIPIGKFGMAKILMTALAGEHTLDTRAGGWRTVVHQEFGDSPRLEDRLDPQYSQIPPSEHGTTLTLRQLKFGESEDFNAERLRRSISRGFPIYLPDFDIFVNGDKCEWASYKTATVFKVNADGNRMGHLEGFVYFLAAPSKDDAGIRIYVAQRIANDPSVLLRRLVARNTLVNRVVGIINADGLDPAVMVNRDGFQTDHPAYKQMFKALQEVMAEVDRYSRTVTTANAAGNIMRKRPHLVEAVQKETDKAGLVIGGTTIVFDQGLPSEQLGVYAPNEKRITLNPLHPALDTRLSANPKAYQRALLDAVVEVIALCETTPGPNQLARFLEGKNSLYERLQGSARAPKRELFPNIAYGIGDLAAYTGRPLSHLKAMVYAGILHAEDGAVLGKDFLQARRHWENFTPLDDVLDHGHRVTARGAYKTDAEHLTELFASAGLTDSPFVQGFGCKGKHFYFVDSSCGSLLYKLCMDNLIHLVGQEDAPNKVKAAFASFGDQYLSVDDLTSKLLLSKGAVTQVIDFAAQENLALLTRKEGKITFYQLAGYVHAQQSMKEKQAA